MNILESAQKIERLENALTECRNGREHWLGRAQQLETVLRLVWNSIDRVNHPAAPAIRKILSLPQPSI